MDLRDIGVGAFGGIAGRVLNGALSWTTLATGMTLAALGGVLIFIMDRLGTPEAASVCMVIFFAMALARFALNGHAGEWSGSIYSGRGGGWGQVAMVAGRYLALCAVWMLPALLIGWRPEHMGELLGSAMMGMGGEGSVVLSAFVVTLMAVSPPLFLIISVGAESITDIFSPQHWSSTFRGRGSDVFLVFTLYLGGLGLLFALSFPILTAVFVEAPKLGGVLTLVAGAWGGGISVSLLGRLCGFFARFADDSPAATGDPVSPSPGTLEETPALSAGAGESRRVIQGKPQKPDLGLIEGGKIRTPSGKPPLMEARSRVDELQSRFERDPKDALAELDRLREEFAPNPLVMHALCLMRHRHNDIPGSLELAAEAMSICRERGATRLAADIYALHLESAPTFSLDRDEVLTFANALRDGHETGAAERVYVSLLAIDPGERRAVKGLLQVAEACLYSGKGVPGDALRIYETILERCPDSPLAAFAQEGMVEAKRRAALG